MPVVPLMPERVFPRLTRAPLREALVDIRLREQLPENWVDKLEHKKFQGFESSEPMKQGSFRFELPKDTPAHASVTSFQPFGRRYDRSDGSRVLQVNRNGMTLSILKNYTNWHVLRAAAADAWKQFLDVSGPVGISRLAVRYINGIALPLGKDYDEYLTAGPRVPPTLPQIVNNFIQRVEVPFASDEAVAIITQTLGPPVASMGDAVLDIDVYAFRLLDGASREVWSVLDRLRIIANDIFFSSIAEKLLESYM